MHTVAKAVKRKKAQIGPHRGIALASTGGLMAMAVILRTLPCTHNMHCHDGLNKVAVIARSTLA